MSDNPQQEVIPPSPPPRRGGRMKWDPTPEHKRLVEAMTACGVPAPIIAKVLQIDGNTLRKHCRLELETGNAKANARVAQFLFNGIFGSPQQAAFQSEQLRASVAMFWLKCRGGWKETVSAEIIRPLSEMSDEEIEARLGIDDPERRDGTSGNVVPYRRR